jgi:hypothetical protein
MNVVTRIGNAPAPDMSMPVATNWAAPANTVNDIKVDSRKERPAWMARMP